MASAHPVINPETTNPLTTANYWESLSEKLPRTKFLDLRGNFVKLSQKYFNGVINENTYYKRLTKLQNRVDNIVSRRPVTNIRNRFNPEELEGEEIELLNRGAETSIGGSTEGEILSVSDGIVAGESVAAAGSSVVTPLVAVGFGSVVAATVGAVANKVYQSGIQVPGTNYVGPGNPLDNGNPTSFVDEDARHHDIAYSVGENIQHHDDIVISQFGDHIAENILDVPAVVGYSGIQAKKVIESHTGQLYPPSK